MNDTQGLKQVPEQGLELADLGDAKEVTQGPVAPNLGEDHPTLIFREQ